MAIKDPHIKGQDSAYRRGLVLGLTMAEIMVLILFTLLLALAATLAVKDRNIAERDKRLSALVALEKQVEELIRKNPEGITVADILHRIERSEEEVNKLRGEIDELKPLAENGKALDDIIQQLKRGGIDNPEPKQLVERLHQVNRLEKEKKELAGQVSRLESEKDTLDGQLSQLSEQIKASGWGNEFPSCWNRNGKAESIFELLITSDGILIKNRHLSHRKTAIADLPLSSVSYGKVLPLSDFQSAVRPLYQWSVDHKCRFYVIRFSSVQSAPIQLVNAINGYFYPDSTIQYRPQGL